MLFVILDLHSACIYGGGLSILKNPSKRTYKDFWICAAEGTRTPTP